ncbi:unnamed protein product [Medioppia subpectinata]|uniref:Uncharacterized protein n=1 Tax=Medioppia subpectinata TaxID=1979941 RepID=A0A7R9KLR5_9ACAR|nr:unnamed protein product [Medioppia subpectinata]CAG2105930.1 unnamed protein product [Medioppia subpectinata]
MIVMLTMQSWAEDTGVEPTPTTVETNPYVNPLCERIMTDLNALCETGCYLDLNQGWGQTVLANMLTAISQVRANLSFRRILAKTPLGNTRNCDVTISLADQYTPPQTYVCDVNIYDDGTGTHTYNIGRVTGC